MFSEAIGASGGVFLRAERARIFWSERIGRQQLSKKRLNLLAETILHASPGAVVPTHGQKTDFQPQIDHPDTPRQSVDIAAIVDWDHSNWARRAPQWISRL